MCTIKNLKEIWKTLKKIEKTSGNPELRITKISSNKVIGYIVKLIKAFKKHSEFSGTLRYLSQKM